MEKYYSFAGVDILIEMPEENAYTEERVLAPFRQTKTSNPHRFSFRMVDEILPPAGVCVASGSDFCVYQEEKGYTRYVGTLQEAWGNAYMRVEHLGNNHKAQIKRTRYNSQTIGVKTVLNGIAAEHLIAQAHGFVFHASFIAHNGRGILFTAPSETGKSTQAELWKRLRSAEIVNGDRSAVRIVEEGAIACGIPFAGSSQICKNETLPLAAIVYLKQAPQTSIRRLRGGEAFRRIWEGCSINVWDRSDVECVSATVEQVVQQVPIFELSCTPDESAVIALEGVLKL